MKTGESFTNVHILNGNAFISSKNSGGLEQGNMENGFEHGPYGNGFEDLGGSQMGKGDFADDFLVDLEEYWEDINDRLTVSRMVSDAVIKGMVTAVEQQASENIATKELELANLKDCLLNHDSTSIALEVARVPTVHIFCENRQFERLSSFVNCGAKHDQMLDVLQGIRDAAMEQLLQIEKEIGCIRGSYSIMEIRSGVKLVGLGGIFQENEAKHLQNIEQVLDCLKSTVETAHIQVGGILHSSKRSFCEWQQEQDLLGKLEDTVAQCIMKSFHEECEEKLWDQHAQFYGCKNANWIAKFNEMASLRTQLSAIVKSLSITETGLVSHGSYDLDHLHRKALSSHVNQPTSLCDGNQEMEEPKTCESYDFNQLKHLSGEAMVKYFNEIISKLRRDHESDIQRKTEEYFSLKRDYLKERGSYVIHRKDEEFDMLRKKIPEVITKVDDFFSGNESFPAMINNAEIVMKLNDKLQCLLSENCKLRDSLSDKINEVKCLEAQVTDAGGKLLQHSLMETSIQKLVLNLKSSAEDVHIKGWLNEEVYKCAMKELIRHTICNSEDSAMESALMREIYEIILCEASLHAENTGGCQIDDPYLDQMILHGLSGMIFKEVIKDAENNLKQLHQEFVLVDDVKNSLQIKVLQGENALKLSTVENKKLKEHVLNLDEALRQKDELALDLSISKSKEREQFEQTFQEHANQLHKLVSASSDAKVKFAEAMDQIELNKIEMHNITQLFNQLKEELAEAIQQKNAALALAQERYDKLLSREASEEGLGKEMKMAVLTVHELSRRVNDFDCRVSGMVRKNNSRLDSMSSHLNSLIEMATELRREGLTYRYKLDRTYSDFQKAEAEVDLLGDEVDALLRLLDKIYIALDHYSPILKHYPGIIEILELVRRELSGESIKPL